MQWVARVRSGLRSAELGDQARVCGRPQPGSFGVNTPGKRAAGAAFTGSKLALLGNATRHMQLWQVHEQTRRRQLSKDWRRPPALRRVDMARAFPSAGQATLARRIARHRRSSKRARSKAAAAPSPVDARGSWGNSEALVSA